MSVYNDKIWEIKSIDDGLEYIKEGADPVLSLWHFFGKEERVSEWWKHFLSDFYTYMDDVEEINPITLIRKLAPLGLNKVIIALDYLLALDILHYSEKSISKEFDYDMSRTITISEVKKRLISSGLIKEEDAHILPTIHVISDKKENAILNVISLLQNKDNKTDEYEIPSGLSGF